MADEFLEGPLRAARWAYEREEETAKLYHNRSQLVLTVVSAFLGLGILRLGTAATGEGARLSTVAAYVVVGFVTAFLVFLVVAAVMVLAGRPGRPKRREHVSGRLVIKDEQIHALSRGDDETFLAETLVGTAKALKDLAESNEDRRGEIQTGLQWLILALVSGVIAVGVYSWAQAGDAETAEANRGTAIAPAHVGEEN